MHTQDKVAMYRRLLRKAKMELREAVLEREDDEEEIPAEQALQELGL